MLNVNDLEIRHKKYKRKYYAPIFTLVGAVIVILISVASFILYNSNNTAATTVEKKEEKEFVVEQAAQIKPVVEEKNSSTEEVSTKIAEEQNTTTQIVAIEEEKEKEEKETIIEKQEKILLSPSLGFINRLESKSASSAQAQNSSDYKEPAEEQKNTPKQEEKIEIKQVEKTTPKIEPKKEEIEEISINIDKKSSINIARKDEQSDITDVIKRFNINHNPALSLFVAKKYYQLGDYEQAYNYALITNDIKNDIEESWLVFSKSLVKLNKKEMAVTTLKKYISHSGSSQAKQLLDEIQTGKFK